MQLDGQRVNRLRHLNLIEDLEGYSQISINNSESINRFNSMYSLEKQLVQTAIHDKPTRRATASFKTDSQFKIPSMLDEEHKGEEQSEGKVLVVDEDVINCEILD